MVDFIVHIRLRECCRDTLSDIDQARAHQDPNPAALRPSLGELPVDQAIDRAPTLLSGCHGGKYAARINRTCITVCERHAETHDNEGARTEAGFWKLLRALFSGEGIQSIKEALQPPQEQLPNDPDGDGLPGITVPPEPLPPNVA